jgi:choline/glycine/proline betaine transport protein
MSSTPSPPETSSTQPSVLSHIAPRVFWPAGIVILAMVLFGAIFTDAAYTALTETRDWISNVLGWYYVAIIATFIVFSLAIGASRYGRMKLGQPDSKPEFSTMSWLAMLFSAGMGIGLVFWGVAEPLAHTQFPPGGESRLEPESVAAAQEAMNVTFVHWGIHAWAIYVVVALAIAWAVHRKGRPLSLRWALEPLLGERVRGWLGDVVDILAIGGTIFGVATSLGLGVLQINAGLDDLGILAPSTGAQMAIIAVITGTAIWSVITGIHKGIKWLSNTNVVLAVALLLFVLFAGPTLFLIREFFEAIGFYAQNVLRTTFTTYNFFGADGEATMTGWTAFYWGWWISWAPFVGMFIARISKGRTIREFVFAVLGVPTIVSFLWFSVLGGTALQRQLFGEGGLEAFPSEQALFSVLDGLPLSGIVTAVAVLLVCTFFVTSSDSGSLVVDMIASGGKTDPPKTTRVFWATMEGLVAAVLLWVGSVVTVQVAGEEVANPGLTALQAASIAAALPFSVVMLGMCWSTLRALQSEYRSLPPSSLERPPSDRLAAAAATPPEETRTPTGVGQD